MPRQTTNTPIAHRVVGGSEGFLPPSSLSLSLTPNWCLGPRSPQWAHLRRAFLARYPSRELLLPVGSGADLVSAKTRLRLAPRCWYRRRGYPLPILQIGASGALASHRKCGGRGRYFRASWGCAVSYAAAPSAPARWAGCDAGQCRTRSAVPCGARMRTAAPG